MLFSRRNHGTNGLLQDATRASSRVAEQAQQTLSGIAEESKGFAQTARTELGDLSREMRDQAGGKVHRARRGTAKKLSQAADAVEPTTKSRSKGHTVLKAALAAVAGWVLVNLARKARDKDADAGSETADAAKAEADAVKADAKAAAARAKAEAEQVKADARADGEPGARHTGSAKPADTSATTRANASSK